MSGVFTEKTASGKDATNQDATSSDMAGREIPVAEADEQNVWAESKLKLIEYSLGAVRNEVFNMRNNDKYMQKKVDDGGFGASADGFDDVSSIDNHSEDDIVGSGSEEEKFVIKGGLKTPHNSFAGNGKIILL